MNVHVSAALINKNGRLLAGAAAMASGPSKLETWYSGEMPST